MSNQPLDLGYGWDGDGIEDIQENDFSSKIGRAIAQKNREQVEQLLSKNKSELRSKVAVMALKYFDPEIAKLLEEHENKKGRFLFSYDQLHYMVAQQAPLEALDFLVKQHDINQRAQQEALKNKELNQNREVIENEDENEDLFAEQDVSNFYVEHLHKTHPWLLKEHYYYDDTRDEYPWKHYYARCFLKKEAVPYLDRLEQIFPTIREEAFMGVDGLHHLLKNSLYEHNDDEVDLDRIKLLSKGAWENVFMNFLYDDGGFPVTKPTMLRLIELLEQHPFLQEGLKKAESQAQQIQKNNQSYFDTWLPAGMALNESPFYKHCTQAELVCGVDGYYTAKNLTKELAQHIHNVYGVSVADCPTEALWDIPMGGSPYGWTQVYSERSEYTFKHFGMPPLPVFVHANMIDLALYKQPKETLKWLMNSETGTQALGEALKKPYLARRVTEEVGFKTFISLIETFPHLVEQKALLDFNLGVHYVGTSGTCSVNSLYKMYQKAPQWFDDDVLLKAFKKQGMSAKDIADFEVKTIKAALKQDEDVKARLNKRKSTAPKRRM